MFFKPRNFYLSGENSATIFRCCANARNVAATRFDKMGLFNLKKKKYDPVTIIQRMIDYMPEHYKTHDQFKNSVEYLDHREWGLALDSLIQLTEETGHYFSEEFWLGLAGAADSMGLQVKVDFCREQISRNKRAINSKTPFGWTTVKIDDTHFQHHISLKLKDEWTRERRVKDKVSTLMNREGIHLKSHGRSGFIYLVDKGRIAELEFELGVNGLILYFDTVDHWTIPEKTKMTEEERELMQTQLTNWSTETKNKIEFN